MPPKENLSRRFVDRRATGVNTLSHGRLLSQVLPPSCPPTTKLLAPGSCNHRPIRCDDDVGESLLLKKILHA